MPFISRKLLATTLVAAGLGAAAVPALAATDTTQFSVNAGTLSLSSAPDVPNLPALTLNGQAQTLNATMSNWTAVDATGSGSGWNLNVQGDSSGGKSAVFKEYCTDGTSTNNCNTAVGGGAGPGYVTSGATVAANSLRLDSNSAAFTAQNGTSGTAPTHSCGTPCNVDS